MPLILLVIGMIAFGDFGLIPNIRLCSLKMKHVQEYRTEIRGFSAFAERAQPVMQAMKMDFSILDQYPQIRFICGIWPMKGIS